MIHRIKKIHIIGGLIVGLVAGTIAYYYASNKCVVSQSATGIYEFDSDRDTKQILEIFNKNWHWLIANEDTSPTFLFKYRTPNANPLLFGKMHIKVLRENGVLAGFISYYVDGPGDWQLLFMAVDNTFRGKGYGKKLVEYALSDMIAQGAERIWLVTRLSNTPAQRIYEAVGFKEYEYTESGYVYFEYIS